MMANVQNEGHKIDGKKKIVENNSKINSHQTWKKKIPKQPKPKVQNYSHCRPKV